MKLTFTFLFLSSLLLIVLSCNSKKQEIQPVHLSGNKYKNYDYCRQLDKMEKCLSDLSTDAYKEMLLLQNTYTNNAFHEVLVTLEQKDKEALIKRKFIDCFRIVAEDAANKDFCTVVELGELDLLAENALIEYTECINRKNNPYIRRLSLDVPRIKQLGDAENDKRSKSI
ncbi:hypothetical protein BDAP_000337 [Binucleata daphniae]